MEITRDEFERYEAVRRSGVTNMWDIRLVSRLAKLEEEKVLDIMKHYNELVQLYPRVRQ